MTDDNVRDLPSSAVDFDLDHVEKDPQDVKPPFRATIGGRVIEMGSPDDVEWQDMLYLENPVELLQFVMSEDDLRHLRAQKLEGWKLGKLMDAYGTHFGLADRLKRARREQLALTGGR